MAIRTETIITRYEVNTVSHEQGVDRIKQKQKQLELQLKDWNEEAKRMEGVHAKAWKTVGLAIGGVTVAVAAGVKAFQSYAREQRLAAAAGAVDMDRLSKAAGGLQTRMELLEFAAKAQHGAFKLTTEQMETAQKAIRQLVREGYDQEEVTKKVTDALVKLEGEGLKDFGVRVREAKTDTEKFNAIMEAYGVVAKKGDGATKTQAESMQELGNRFKDAFQKIQSSIGQMVVSMTPLVELVSILATKTATIVDKIAGGWGDLVGLGAAAFGGRGSDADKAFMASHGLARDKGSNELYLNDAEDTFVRHGGSREDFRRQQRINEGAKRMEPMVRGMMGDLFGSAMKAWEDIGTIEMDPMNVGKRKGGAGGGVDVAAQSAARKLLRSWVMSEATNAAPSGGDALGFAAETGDEFGRDLMSTIDLSNYGRTQSAADEYNAMRAGKQTSYLESTFGTLQEFDAYKSAFETLTSAVSSSMTAWIDGSMSAGAAFKKGIGEAMKALSVEASVQALRHLALAAGYAFIPGMQGSAAGALKAAAMWGVVAVAAGGAAKSLSSGGGGASAAGAGAGAGAAAPSYAPSSSSQQPGSHNTIIYGGPDLNGSSDRQRMVTAKRIVNAAQVSFAGGEFR